MLLLISDANILIDVEIGGLVAPMFSLEYQFAVPDVLFYEELEERHSYMLEMGLVAREFDEAMVMRVVQLASQSQRLVRAGSGSQGSMSAGVGARMPKGDLSHRIRQLFSCADIIHAEQTQHCGTSQYPKDKVQDQQLV